MLNTFAFIKIKIFFHLRFLLTFSRFIDRKFHIPIPVTHYLTHQGAVFRRDILIIKTQDILKAHHIFVKLHPRVHLVPTHITYTMIDIFQSNGCWIVIAFDSHKTRHKGSVILFTFYKHMHHFAVSMYTAHTDFAMRIRQCSRLHIGFGATFHGLLIGIIGVINPKRQYLHAITMLHMMGGNRMI